MGGTAGDCSEAVASAFSTMRLIVSVGWSIYPIGFVLGWTMGEASEVGLNVTYNIADLVNKIAFVLACWSCAKQDSAAKHTMLPRCKPRHSCTCFNGALFFSRRLTFGARATCAAVRSL